MIKFLRNWYFSSQDYKGETIWITHGNVYGNPEFEDGFKIHTSIVKKISIGDSYLDVYTKNSIYRCLFCESMEKHFIFIDTSSLFDESVNKSDLDTLKEKIISELEISKKYDEEKICESIHHEKECLIMIFSDKRDYYFEDFIIKMNEKMVHYSMFAHVGTFQDSILINSDSCELQDDAEEIDFRYFPYKGNRISFYNWEGYSGKIYAINKGVKEIEIDTACGKFLLQPNNNPYLISKDTLIGRIEEPIAPAVDMYSVWDVHVDEDGNVSYGVPKDEGGKK